MQAQTPGGERRRTHGWWVGRTVLALAGTLLLAGGLGHPRVALAAGTVGSGSPGSCTTAALDAALAGGGTVTFNCGGGPVTIVDHLTISQDTTLDGTGQHVTISGGGSGGSVITVNGGVTLNLTALTISGGNASIGAGIKNYGTVTLTNSTVSGNRASDLSGGIENIGTLTLLNSTVSGNSASFDGGGVVNDGGMLTLTNSTVASNSTGGDFGGLDNAAGTVVLSNTIVASNTAAEYPDCVNNLISHGYNLIGNNQGCLGLTNGVNGDQVGGSDPGGSGSVIDAKLGPLADNGGPTFTMALLPGSPAIDYVPSSHLGGLTTDQRGLPRPDAGEGLADIGAYEVQDPGTPPGPGGSGTATPELGSGELLATGLLPLGLALVLRRRRARHATQKPTLEG